jgi:hypothetical protein
LYDCVATVFLNVHFSGVFVGNGYLVPSCLPQLRELFLEFSYGVHDEYVEVLKTALPELQIIK